MNIDVHAHHIPHSILERLKKDGAPYGVEIAADTPEGPRLRFGAGLEPIRPILNELQDINDRKSRKSVLPNNTVQSLFACDPSKRIGS